MSDRPAWGPWHPGIVSPVPRELRPLITLFRPDNGRTSFDDAEELHDLTGLPISEIAALRPSRLALHEVLVRVTADISVPDGPRIEDLGINFRAITRTLLERYIAPRMEAIEASWTAMRSILAGHVGSALDALASSSAGADPAPRGWLARLRQRRDGAGAGAEQAPAEVLAAWEARLHGSADAAERAALRALVKVASAQIIRHGRLWGDTALLARLATDIACNEAGSEAIGQLVAPLLSAGAAREGYGVLHAQAQPVVMNTKGPSASGKSTIRPLQRTLAGRIGVNWSEFALISPDIWRKQLIDYGSLGEHYRYGGAFTGDELHIIDRKLDRYMAAKAERGNMPHLLIDRFRFDSFAPDSDEAGSNLLTRFGQVVYLFFMLTPPASLVERAWMRGLEVGRYKAVDDVLAHGIEAYAGMPELFFTWMQRTDKRVHAEFLDNSVRQGERPRTVAFGWNDTLHVLDVNGLLDVDRYRRINVDATTPAQLFPAAEALEPARNVAFLRACIERIPAVEFADRGSGRIYLRIERGTPVWSDSDALAQALADGHTSEALHATVPAAFDRPLARVERACFLDPARRLYTVGRWGEA